MRCSVLLSLLLLVLAVPLFAAPTITGFDPQEGFSYGPTHVRIDGSGFTGGALTVLFGSEPATIIAATDTRIIALANRGANPTDRPVDIVVRVAGKGEATLTNAFLFHPEAQANPEDYTAAIVPLTMGRVPGAHGSLWEAELHVFNASTQLLRMPGPEATIIELPIDFAVKIDPRTTERVDLAKRANGVDGHFLYIPKPLVDAPKFSLRVRDVSENATSLGDDVPVIREDRAFNDLVLADIPVDPHYRPTLRIYAFTPAPMTVGVSVYPEDGDTPFSQTDVQLHGIVTTDYVPFPPHPAYLAFDPFTPQVRAAGGRVRIEISNHSSVLSPPPPPIWAFVSLTNNDTNQVTMVTPK